MTKYKDIAFLNFTAAEVNPKVDCVSYLTEVPGGGGNAMHNPSDISRAFLSQGEEKKQRTQQTQNLRSVLATNQLSYAKEKSLLGTQRFRLTKLLIRQSKKEFLVIKGAFEILAQTPTGRETLLTIPESTSYVLAKLPSLAQMYGEKRQIIFSDDESLYKMPLAETVDTLGHEYTHLINYQHIYSEPFQETEADFFVTKMLDEVTARMHASQIVHEARKMNILPRKLGSRPLSVEKALKETTDIGYQDFFIKTVCENRHISPFLLARNEVEHSTYFMQKIIPYFMKAFPDLEEKPILENLRFLYKKSVMNRANELLSTGCKVPAHMVAAFRHKDGK